MSATATTEMFPETVTAVPPGYTPSWFTPLPWFLELERRLLAQGVIPRPFDMDGFGHPDAPVAYAGIAPSPPPWSASATPCAPLAR